MQEASRVMADPDLRREQVMQAIVDLLPGAWQYPEDASARIRLGEHEYRSMRFAQSKFVQQAALVRDGTRLGSIEVYYRSTHATEAEGSFLAEERQLLDTLSRQLSDYLRRLEIEDRLRQEQSQLLALFEGTDDVIYVADPNTYELLYVNAAFRKSWGDRSTGRLCHQVLQDRDSPCPFCTNPLIFGDKLGETHVWEFQNELTKRWFRCADKAIRWSDGRMVRYEIAADITTEKRQLQERAQLDKMSALGRLTAGVAHELNNPLMGIINYAQYCLSETSEDDPRHEALCDIERETRRCVGIVQGLLTYSRSRDEGETLIDCDLWGLVDRSLKLLDYRLRAECVSLEMDRTIDLPPIPLKPEKFQQVIVNLLTNALDAMKGRDQAVLRITIDIDANCATLTIADNGSGIPLEVRERIFDPFFSTKQTGEGTGLGLSTCLALVQELGGELNFTSRVGLGTVMNVQVPAMRPDESKA